MSSRDKMTLNCCCVPILLTTFPPPPEPLRNVSIAAVRGAVRPSKKKNDTEVVNPPFIVPSLSLAHYLWSHGLIHQYI